MRNSLIQKSGLGHKNTIERQCLLSAVLVLLLSLSMFSQFTWVVNSRHPEKQQVSYSTPVYHSQCICTKSKKNRWTNYFAGLAWPPKGHYHYWLKEPSPKHVLLILSVHLKASWWRTWWLHDTAWKGKWGIKSSTKYTYYISWDLYYTPY